MWWRKIVGGGVSCPLYLHNTNTIASRSNPGIQYPGIGCPSTQKIFQEHDRISQNLIVILPIKMLERYTPLRVKSIGFDGSLDRESWHVVTFARQHYGSMLPRTCPAAGEAVSTAAKQWTWRWDGSSLTLEDQGTCGNVSSEYKHLSKATFTTAVCIELYRFSWFSMVFNTDSGVAKCWQHGDIFVTRTHASVDTTFTPLKSKVDGESQARRWFFEMQGSLAWKISSLSFQYLATWRCTLPNPNLDIAW